jgi:hypothetical protein
MKEEKDRAFRVLPSKERKYLESYSENLKDKDDRMSSSCLFYFLFQILPLELLLNSRGKFCAELPTAFVKSTVEFIFSLFVSNFVFVIFCSFLVKAFSSTLT